MKIHNFLNPAQRARTINALEALVNNLPKCKLYPNHPDGLFTLKNGEDGVETLHLRLRSYEVSVFVAIRHGKRLLRTSFVEHLRPDHSAKSPTFAEAVSRLPKWRRYLDDTPSDDMLRDVQNKTQMVVQAAVGAATLLDDRWTSMGIHPAFGTKPPMLFLREPPGKTWVFGAAGAKAGAFGTMSDELVRELSRMSDYLFVTSSKTSSNPGFQIAFGELPSIHVANDLTPMDLLRATNHADKLGLSLQIDP